MVAVFDVMLDTAGTDATPGSETITTNVRHKSADDNTQDTNNPCVVPAAGTNYSYWRQIYLQCTTGPDTQVDNIKFYTDGTLGWGVGITMMVGNETPTKNSGSNAGYEVATGTPGTSGDEMVGAHAGLTGSTDVFSYTSGASKSVSISEAGSIINAIGEMCNYIILQLNIATTATSGTKATETLTFQYDEI